MKKRVLILLLLAAVAAAGYSAKNWYTGEADTDGSALKVYGTVDIRDVSLAFNEQERLTEVLVEEGESVAAGQVLARLTTSRLDAQIAETEARILAQQETVQKLTAGNRPQEIEKGRAEVAAARAQMENTGQVVARISQTSATGATSQQDLDDARSRLLVEQAQLRVKEKQLDLLLEGYRQEDIAAAEHQLAALKANLQLLTVRFGDMTLIAPANGTIDERILEAGEMAGPARPVFTLALTDPKWVRAYLPEPELGRVRPGMPARVVNDSTPGEDIAGWVGFISSIAEFTPRTVQTEDLRTRLVYEIRVMVRDPENRLRLGLPVTVFLDSAPVQQHPPAAQAAPTQH